MKLSERVLEIFDAQVAIDRSKIIEQISDLDSLGEILATAHYASVEMKPEQIHAQGDRILLTGPRSEAKLEWMLQIGFTLRAADRSGLYTHNRLTHPRLHCEVVILTLLVEEPK
ncbi:hypothetical protein [Cupriavidus sp. BIC8F]|uniref:hypothetical protein n=1 Tax=Cupriavidus sp. BIC8F TaxID=3079014 RepID=UPI002915DD7B|nr:hypothetical protein [Cupriavidus sp. BIC8F]